MHSFCVSLLLFTLFCQVFVVSTFINFLTIKKASNSTRNNNDKRNRGTVSETSGSGYTHPAEERCTCKPVSQCSPPLHVVNNTAPSIDIRIVTKPSGEHCETGVVYCCPSKLTNCGKKSTIPISGVVIKPGQAQFGEYPWQAIILGLNNDYIGSGALIDNLHVLTVAHRITQYQKGELIIRLGDWDVQVDIEPYEQVDVRVVDIVVHPQYNSKTLQYDIAILTLDQAIRVFPHIQPVCLPSTNSTFIGKKCWVSGWGKDMFGHHGNYQNIQKQVDVTILDNNVCETQLRGTRLGPQFQLDRTSFICAGGENGKDACTGDGGSPLVCELYGHWYLVGLVAWGIGCAQPNVPGIYVNIINLLPWISQCVR